MPLTRIFKADFSPRLVEIRVFTAIVSLVFSLVAFGIDDLINSDGVLYMNMVRAFLEGGLTETAQLFNWPFFSILVSGIHILTGLSLETSGELLNVLLFVLFTDSLVLICSNILPNSRQVFIAALFILGFTLFNDYRAYLFRDMGYWAFTGYSLYLLIKFSQKPSWFYALTWQGTMIMSILFRIEGVVLLLAMPFFLFKTAPDWKIACKQIVMLWSLVIIIVGIALSIALSQTSLVIAFGKISEIISYIDFPTLLQDFRDKSEIINAQVMSHFDKDSGALILASGLLVMILQKIITALSVSYIVFYLYTYFSKHAPQHIQSNYHQLFIFFVAVNFLILLMFVFKQYFLSTRYGVMLITGLFLLMLPRICTFVENAWLQKRKGVLFFTFLIVVAGPIDTFTVSVFKGYIKDAAIWAAENLPENSKTITSDLIIDYYMRENNSKTQVELDTQNRPLNISTYDYVIVTIKTNSDGVEKYLGKNLSEFEIVHSNANRRGDKVLVLEISE